MERDLAAFLAQQDNHPNLTPEDIARLQELFGRSNLGSPNSPEDKEEEEDNNPPKDFQFIDGDDYEKALQVYLTKSELPTKMEVSEMALLMMKIGFGQGDFANYLKSIYSGAELKTGLCRKLLRNKTDVGYQCLDCQKDSTCIICAQCFEKSDHKGHRYDSLI